MNDENKGRPLTPEEAASEARKKKIQGFKLHIDDFGIGEASETPVKKERTRTDSIDAILRDIESSVKADKVDKAAGDDSRRREAVSRDKRASRKDKDEIRLPEDSYISLKEAIEQKPEKKTEKEAVKKRRRFVPPVYVEPDLNREKKSKDDKLSADERAAAIENFTPEHAKETPEDEMQRLASAAQEKLEIPDEETDRLPSLTPEQLDELTKVATEEEQAEDDDIISSYSDEELRKKMDLADKEQLKEYKKSVKKRVRKKAKRNGCMFKLVWLVMVVFVATLLGLFLIRGTNDMLAINRGALQSTVTTDAENGTAEENSSVKKVNVDISANATLDEVTDILVENGIINEPMFFKLYTSITKSGEPFLEGSFELETNMDYEAILNCLLYDAGPKSTVTVCFTEGMSVRDMARELEENNVCKMDKFLEACNSDDFDDDYDFIAAIENDDQRYYKLEGYLFPDTYTFYVNDDVNSVIEKFLDNFENKICTETKRYSGYSEEMTVKEYAELKGMTIDYVINLSSLVQAEAADENDMYTIASIFFNRLSTDATDGMTPYGDYDVNKLRSDPTIYYPYDSADDVPDEIADTFESTYNTYNITGLPPGPINNPGENAIAAVLDPASTSYYFFCHKAATDTEPAVAYYATTYAEQVQNEITAGLRDPDDTE